MGSEEGWKVVGKSRHKRSTAQKGREKGEREKARHKKINEGVDKVRLSSRRAEKACQNLSKAMDRMVET